MNHIKEFLPFILPILTAIVGYIFGQKTSKVNRFYSQNENNLKNIIEPLYFGIKSIKREKSTFQKEKLLDKLFDSYILENKGIYQLGNKDLVDSN
ncbi:hypothetical protein CON64_20905 [Bacillus pseudomycoides]|nr:hypothetical protein CON64_20905 [Bacillus pseudomycoides]